jgi:predicted HAD superfamily hydrolase
VEEWNKIIEAIESNRYEYISFDIFDTLLMRPFWEPTDLFYFLGIYANSLNIVNNEFEFMQIRRKAEEETRLRAGKNIEDITIDEIYVTLNNLLGSNCNVEDLKKHELGLEVNFCYRRQSGYELYCKAVKSNKRIICISDMYLKEQEIQALLNQNGYSQIERIYLSSEIRLGKYTGNLYQHVIENLGIVQKDRMLHIGDNINSDIIMARKSGLEAFYLEKAKDIYLKNTKVNNNQLLSTRIEKAIEMNTQYDNPFIENAYLYDPVIFDKMFENYHNNIADCNCIIWDKKPSIISKVRNKFIRYLS